MYVIEIVLRMNPVSVSVQRKKYEDAQALYQKVREAFESVYVNGRPRLLDLTCEKMEDKKLTVLVSEILAIQLYEKTSIAGGGKSPGFSIDS